MKPILNDPQQIPTLDLLRETLNSNYPNYQKLLELLEKYSLTTEWRYYNDGKSWLCKVWHKKKNLFWISVWEDCFKTTFYFTEKEVENIAALPLSEDIKSQFFMQKPIGRLIAMIIAVRNNGPLSDIDTVIGYKLKKNRFKSEP